MVGALLVIVGIGLVIIGFLALGAYYAPRLQLFSVAVVLGGVAVILIGAGVVIFGVRGRGKTGAN